MLNSITLIGHVGQDPEIKALQSGDEMAVFNLATTDKWKDKDSGERKEKTEWHRVVCFNKHVVGVIKQYVKKGSKLYIEGSMTYRKWDDNGVEKQIAEVTISQRGKLVLLDGQRRDDTPPDSAYNG